MFPGFSLASLVLPVLLACFGPLVVGQNCPYPDPFDHTVLLPDHTDCSRFFMCSNGKPVQHHCPAGLHFNELLKVCDYPHNVNCVPRKFFSVRTDLLSYWSMFLIIIIIIIIITNSILVYLSANLTAQYV
jgi:hypothetical protein